MRVLIAGETWVTHKVEIKGFTTYSTGGYAVGLTELVEGLRANGHEVVHVPNHEAVERFPWTLDEFAPYDVVVLSDIAADTIQLTPACLERGYNRLRAKPDAAVVMTVDEDPFLVLGSYGRGRTAAFASDCSPHWGSPEFLAWPDYGRFWSQLVSWLARA